MVLCGGVREKGDREGASSFVLGLNIPDENVEYKSPCSLRSGKNSSLIIFIAVHITTL